MDLVEEKMSLCHSHECHCKVSDHNQIQQAGQTSKLLAWQPRVKKGRFQGGNVKDDKLTDNWEGPYVTL